MTQSANLLLVSISIVSILCLVIMLLFKTPGSNNYYIPLSGDIDPSIRKLVKVFGPDIVALSPSVLKKSKTKTEEIELLITKSGNPWGITATEFTLITATLFVLGIILGIILAALFAFLVPNLLIIGIIIGFITPFCLSLIPKAKYQSDSATREMEFKKNLPESIDLLIMALSGGNYTLINGIEEIIPHMEETVIKEEFVRITQDVESGMSVSESLRNMAERVPTEGIKAFVKALINANEQSVDLTEILKARARASRKELKDEAEKRIMKLPTKVMGVLSPTSALCVCAVAIAPSAYMLIQVL